MRQPYELTDWNDAELIGVSDLPPDLAFGGVYTSPPSDASASWQPQLYRTAEGYIGTLDLVSGPQLDTAPPTKEATTPPRFDVTVNASTHEITTTCRARAHRTFTKPVGYVAIGAGMRSIDVAAAQTLPVGVEVNLHLSDRLGDRRQSVTSLQVDMPGEGYGAFMLVARAGSGKFDQVQISGKGIERQLLEQGVEVYPIGDNLSALRADQDKARLIGYLSGILTADLSLPLNRHATALRLYKTMGHDDFSVLDAMVWTQGAERGASTQRVSKLRMLQPWLRPLQERKRRHRE